jgi:hypothetical protein
MKRDERRFVKDFNVDFTHPGKIGPRRSRGLASLERSASRFFSGESTFKKQFCVRC